MKGSKFGALRIAFTYIGAVIGAGFASGQEILRFFGAHGITGIIGIPVSCMLFFFFGYSALLMGKNLNANSHVDIVRYTNGRLLGGAIDVIITIFLFGGLGAMIAGAGAVFEEQFGIGAVWGTLAMAILTMLTILTGTKGTVNAISTVVPLLIFAVLFIFIYNLAGNPLTQKEIEAAEAVASATPHWLLSALNYASYNLTVSIAVLAPIGSSVRSGRSLFWGALLGALGLGTGIAAINFCLLTNIFDASFLEIPMAAVASKISIAVKFLFSAMLFCAIYSTAVANLYGLTRRVSLNINKPLLACLATAGAFIAGQLGFSNLVRFMYPAVGYGALLFFAGTVRKWIKTRGALK